MRKNIKTFDEERERKKLLNRTEHDEMERKRLEYLTEQELKRA
jgi:hypothetical protein